MRINEVQNNFKLPHFNLKNKCTDSFRLFTLVILEFQFFRYIVTTNIYFSFKENEKYLSNGFIGSIKLQ